jgi:hypothetical protein
MSDRAGLPASFDTDRPREPDDTIEVRPDRTEVAVLNFPPGTVARVRTWDGKAGKWEYREIAALITGSPLVAAVPGDRDGLGWGARYVFYGGLAGIRNGHHRRDRAIWHEAAKAVRSGGVAYVRHEQQDYYGKTIWVAVSVRQEG